MATYEGFGGYIAPEIRAYFEEKYFNQNVRVVPGHWPNMYTKKDVDEYFNSLEIFSAAARVEIEKRKKRS